MAIYVLSRRKPSGLDDPANLLKRFSDVHRNVAKDLEDKSEFSNLAFSLIKAKAIIILPPAIKFQSIYTNYPSFVNQQVVESIIPEMNKILTDYTQLLSEYAHFEKKASSRTDLLEAYQQKIVADKVRPLSKKLFDIFSSFNYLFGAAFSAMSALTIYKNQHSWLHYLTLITIPLGILMDRTRQLYRYMTVPSDKQIAGIGSLKEFELQYLSLSRRLNRLKKDASELHLNLTLMCSSDLDTILLGLLKDTPFADSENKDLLRQISKRTHSVDLIEELARVLQSRSDLLSKLRMRPMA